MNRTALFTTAALLLVLLAASLIRADGDSEEKAPPSMRLHAFYYLDRTAFWAARLD